MMDEWAKRLMVGGTAAAAVAVGSGFLIRRVMSGKRPSSASSKGCDLSSLGLGKGLEHRFAGGASWGDSSPIVVAFHGMGGRPGWMLRALDGVSAKAKIIAPRGFNALGSNRAWWFERAASPDQKKLAAQMKWSLDELAPALDKARSCNPGAPLVLVGHSQGGMLAASLGARVAAERIVAASAWVPKSMWSALKGATLLHGSEDDTVPFARSAQWAEEVGATWRPMAGGHGLTGQLKSTFVEAVNEAAGGA